MRAEKQSALLSINLKTVLTLECDTLHKHTHTKTAYHEDLITQTINNTGHRHNNKEITITATLPGQ